MPYPLRRPVPNLSFYPTPHSLSRPLLIPNYALPNMVPQNFAPNASHPEFSKNENDTSHGIPRVTGNFDRSAEHSSFSYPLQNSHHLITSMNLPSNFIRPLATKSASQHRDESPLPPPASPRPPRPAASAPRLSLVLPLGAALSRAGGPPPDYATIDPRKLRLRNLRPIYKTEGSIQMQKSGNKSTNEEINSFSDDTKKKTVKSR